MKLDQGNWCVCVCVYMHVCKCTHACTCTPGNLMKQVMALEFGPGVVG